MPPVFPNMQLYAVLALVVSALVQFARRLQTELERPIAVAFEDSGAQPQAVRGRMARAAPCPAVWGPVARLIGMRARMHACKRRPHLRSGRLPPSRSAW